MPSITYDGRSFMIDGRRIWLVSGSIPYANVCREHWADRIQAAKQAGLNTIDTPIFWNRHEPRPGRFDFTGDLDLRAFVKLVHQAGMYCIIRLGPFVDHDADMGGLPAWLNDLKNVKLRASNHAFLEACSRFISAVAGQIRDLQITAPGKPESPGTPVGPVLLIQNESSWTCGDQDQANAYLGELVRYIREAGFEVPLLNDNNLWQGVEGEIDCWSGNENLLSAMRQMSGVRADQPRIVIDFELGKSAMWGVADQSQPPAWLVQRRLAETLAGGGQFNLQPLHGGTASGFHAGRSPAGIDLFCAPASHSRGLVTQTGAAGPSYALIRRLCTFASRFSRVFAALDPSYAPVTIDPDLPQSDGKHKGHSATPCSVTHVSGSQGGVVFVFGGDPSETEAGRGKSGNGGSGGGGGRQVQLMMPDGASVPIDLGTQAVGWFLMNTHLAGRAHLDYCTLNAFALVGKVLVVYGVAGFRGVVSINGSPLDVVVPSGHAPTLIEHEGVFVCVFSEEGVDHAYVTDEGVYYGVQGLALDGAAVVHASQKTYHKITSQGEQILRPTDPPKVVVKPAPVPEPEVVKGKGKKKDEKPKGKGKKGSSAPPPPPPPPPFVERVHKIADKVSVEKAAMSAWTCASIEEYADGTSPRFANIAGPMELSALGAPYGYGWYRVRPRNVAAGKTKVILPVGGDRVHFYSDGSAVGILGVGPGAVRELSVPLKKAASQPVQSLVMLAENLGRFSGGVHLGEAKGLASHLLEVEPLKIAPPKVVVGEPIDVLSFRTPLWEVRKGDVTSPQRLTWSIGSAGKKSGLVIEFRDFPGRGLLVVNDKPVAYVDQSGPAFILLEPEALAKGASGSPTIQISPIIDAAIEEMAERGATAQDMADRFAGSVVFLHVVGSPTQKAEWAFAKWELPAESAFKAVKGKLEGPAWWRATFTTTGKSTPLLLELAGLTKGQIYLNGKHLGRYFIATADGKKVQPQESIWLPDPWLKEPGVANELTVFDEHGHSPARCRLHFDASAVPVRAHLPMA